MTSLPLTVRALGFFALLLATAQPLRAQDGAMQFTAASQQYVEVPNFQGLGITNEVTVEFWAKAAAVVDQSAFMLYQDDTDNRFQAHITYGNGSTYWDFGNIDGGGRLQAATPANTVGNWVHYALVASQNGNFMKIYVNGTQIATKTGMTAFQTAATYALRIGGSTNNFFGGALDEFRVWSVARTQAQIQGNLGSTLVGNENGLKLYFKFDETSGPALNSATATGAARNGTLTNNPTRLASGAFTSATVTSYTVKNTNDAGADSLRQTLLDAAVTAGPALITFAPALSGQTISLTGPDQGSAIEINDAGGVTLDATSLPGGLTLKGKADQGSAGSFRHFSVASGTSLTLRGLTLANGGGAFSHDGGAIYNSGTLTLTQCTLSGNSSQGGIGGAIFNNATLTLTQCILSGKSNQAGLGGAIFNNATLTLTQSTLSGNSASGGSGGAIYNSATQTLTQCTLSGNSASRGGAIYGSGTLTHCTLTGNTASGRGGAIDVDGAVTLRHCTVAGNSAGGSGGGVASFETMLVLENSLVAGNTLTGSGSGADIYNAGTVNASGANIVQAAIVNLAGFGTVNGSATITNADPLLASLADNGGPTQTMALLSGSPALDAATVIAGLETDQRGFHRNRDGDATAGAVPDIGAYEAQLPPTGAAPELTVVTTADDENNPNGTLGNGISLREALRDAPAGGGIVFDSTLDGALIFLDEDLGQIEIAKSVTIDASTLATGITVDGGSGDNRIFNISSGKTVSMLGLTLTGGAAISTGGAIYNDGTLALTRCTLSGNLAVNGGAIYNTGTLTLTHCTLSGNSAIDSGGAIVNSDNSDGGALTLTHCTLSGNSASFSGGAIVNSSDGALTLTHCTLSGNSADLSGGAIANFGTLTLTNSIVAGNRIFASGVDFDNSGGTVTSGGGNLIGNNASVAAEFPEGPLVGTSGNLLNPLLADLASNGGPTKTRALLLGSPARNAAVDSTATGDQRGYPIVGTADIGAFEVQASSISLTSSANPSLLNEAVTVTATVTAVAPETVTPTGTVTFTVDGIAQAPINLAAGIATLTLTPGSYGWQIIGATYSGDARLAATTSSDIEQTVVDLTVTNGGGSGSGSLAQALADAALHPGPDTIPFLPGFTGPIVLNGELVVTDAAGVTIDVSNVILGVKIDGNNAGRLFTVSNGTVLTLRGLHLTGGNGVGTLQSGSGGAILNLGTLTVDRCTLSANTATGYGGALKNDAGATLTLTQSTLAANHAAGAGAVLNQGALQMTHVTISANSIGTAITTGAGGGLFNAVVGSASLTNCIVAGNTLFAGGADDVFNNFGTLRFTGPSIVPAFDNLGSGVTDPMPITAPPLLSPLGNYGGTLPTMPPLIGSPAIDQATVVNPALITDQRGQPRPLGLRPDLGAVEGLVIVVTTAADELDAPGIPGAGFSLREAIRDVEAGGTVTFDRAIFTGATATTNTITLTKGPLNPQRACTLDGSANPGGIKIVHTLTITAQPLPQSVVAGATANFAVTVTNLSGGAAYQWRRDGATLGGETNAALAIANAQEANEDVYDVLLSEAAAPGALTLTNVTLTPAGATSQPASLVVDGSALQVQRISGAGMIALGSSRTLSVV
ncbi:MAG: choice-of-anchor Q domain-containing protein, partial [Prosthecobacter sp.]|nr:choice-of-anchor Q domain-containing protein [Prosthecobacter sp.]